MPMASSCKRKPKRQTENQTHNNTPFLFSKILKIALPQTLNCRIRKVHKTSKLKRTNWKLKRRPRSCMKPTLFLRISRWWRAWWSWRSTRVMERTLNMWRTSRRRTFWARSILTTRKLLTHRFHDRQPVSFRANSRQSTHRQPRLSNHYRPSRVLNLWLRTIWCRVCRQVWSHTSRSSFNWSRRSRTWRS